MLDLFHGHGCEVFMQNNAPCHKVYKGKQLPPTKVDLNNSVA